MSKKIRAVYYVRDSFTTKHYLTMLDMAKKAAKRRGLRVCHSDLQKQFETCQIEGDVFSKFKHIAIIKASIASKILDTKYALRLKFNQRKD